MIEQNPTDQNHAFVAGELAELRQRRMEEARAMKARCDELEERFDQFEETIANALKAIVGRLDKLDGGKGKPAEGEEIGKKEPPPARKKSWL